MVRNLSSDAQSITDLKREYGPPCRSTYNLASLQRQELKEHAAWHDETDLIWQEWQKAQKDTESPRKR